MAYLPEGYAEDIAKAALSAPTRYGGVRFKSRTEARWAIFFDSSNIAWEYEKEKHSLQSGKYTPDFWLSDLKCWFEVKGTSPTAEEQALARELAVQTGFPVYIFGGQPRAAIKGLVLNPDQSQRADCEFSFENGAVKIGDTGATTADPVLTAAFNAAADESKLIPYERARDGEYIFLHVSTQYKSTHDGPALIIEHQVVSSRKTVDNVEPNTPGAMVSYFMPDYGDAAVMLGSNMKKYVCGLIDRDPKKVDDKDPEFVKTIKLICQERQLARGMLIKGVTFHTTKRDGGDFLGFNWSAVPGENVPDAPSVLARRKALDEEKSKSCVSSNGVATRKPWIVDGWQPHPHVSGWFWKGTEAKPEADLAVMYGSSATVTVKPWIVDGWQPHPHASGWFWKGTEVKPEADLVSMYANVSTDSSKADSVSPPLTEEQRQRVYQALLLKYQEQPLCPSIMFGNCGGCKQPMTDLNASRLHDGKVKHIGCPVDAPAAIAIAIKVDPVTSAVPLSPEAIATIQNPALKERAEAHAALAQARQAEEDIKITPIDRKASGKCPAGGRQVQIAQTDVVNIKKYPCPDCGKKISLKEVATDYTYATLPGHIVPKSEEGAAPATAAPAPAGPPPLPPGAVAAPAGPPPLPAGAVPVAPPLPVAPPVAVESRQAMQVANFGIEPGALPGQTSLPLAAPQTPPPLMVPGVQTWQMTPEPSPSPSPTGSSFAESVSERNSLLMLKPKVKALEDVALEVFNALSRGAPIDAGCVGRLATALFAVEPRTNPR